MTRNQLAADILAAMLRGLACQKVDAENVAEAPKLSVILADKLMAELIADTPTHKVWEKKK